VGLTTEDDWGFDAGFTRATAPLLDALYDRWWRVRVAGAHRVPAAGPALVVANQAGGPPWDAAMLATALRRHGGRRDDDPRFFASGRAFELPWVSTALRRLGGVPDAPGNAARLLAEGHVVLVFPAGGRGLGPGVAERYRVDRLSAGPSIELALRAGAPIVPCALVAGGPGLADRALARVQRLPRPPLPVPTLPPPAAWRIAFADPVQVAQHGPAAADDPALVLELADDVRARIQQKVYDSLVNGEGES
jgi:1-acyl-sn-glycerol-3-phosphate acyltransferase